MKRIFRRVGTATIIIGRNIREACRVRLPEISALLLFFLWLFSDYLTII